MPMAGLLFEGERSEECDKLTGFVTDHSSLISEIDPFRLNTNDTKTPCGRANNAVGP